MGQMGDHWQRYSTCSGLNVYRLVIGGLERYVSMPGVPKCLLHDNKEQNALEKFLMWGGAEPM